MTSELWLPLSARLAGREGLREGVPVALRQPLRAWIHAQVIKDDMGIVASVKLRLGLVGDGYDEVPPEEWLGYCTRDRDLLDIADAILGLAARRRGNVAPVDEMPVLMDLRQRKMSLQELLDDARSVYTVRADASGLERRAGVIATKAHAAAAEAAAKPDAGSAARHLRDAWSAAYALRPDPVLAYSEAVKAVESASHAVLEPGNSRATLGR